MYSTRITASALLTHGNKVLLLKRRHDKKLAPGMWAGIGGHMEMADITDPRALNLIETCYRELYEEAGISSSAVRGLRLRYIAARKMENDIRFHYQFIGELASEIPPPPCDEGELHWVNIHAALDLPMTVSVKTCFTHWAANPHSEGIFLAVIDPQNENGTVLPI